MAGFFLPLSVFVSGAVVLILEILGTRLLGPYYGVSLYLWSALIGVTLAALSTGYVLGGRWADDGPRLDRYSLVLFLAGLWIIAVPWMRHPVLDTLTPTGLRTAVLVAACVLFFPPLALLGMISPYAIRLRARRLEEVGRTAGDLYALSTIAGVAAALATGFYLIPHFGIGRLTFLTGLALVITSLVGFAVHHGGRVGAGVAVLAAAVAVAAPRVAPALRADPQAGLLAIEDSAYGELRVIDRDGMRLLLIDGGVHTIADPTTWASGFPYVDVLDLTKRFFAEPGRMLLVGLGGGSVAKSFAKDGWRVTAVEIDPAVVDVARRWFDLEPADAVVHLMDGRRFIANGSGKYDLVILDAYGSSSVPFHMVTRESFAQTRERLAPGGVLAMNVEAVGWNDVFVRSLATTLRTLFKHVEALPIAEPPDRLGNLVLVASDRELDPGELPRVLSRESLEYDQNHAWDNRFEPEAAGAPVLTDDRNPSGLWVERINLTERNELHSYFGRRGNDW